MSVQQLSGEQLGRYQFDRCLGYSSHTGVYRASNGRPGEWAVKVIDGDLEPEGSLADRLRRDAERVSRLDDPEIIPIYEVARHGTLTVAASPLMTGPTLRDLLNRGPLQGDMAWGVLCQLAEALDRLHARGLCHRGVKPVNILVDGPGRVRLVECGVSSQFTGRLALAAPDYRLADPSYLAPEQIRGAEGDWRADIYALAVLAFELLTGRAPFTSPRAADVLRSSLGAPPPAPRTYNPELPPGVDAVLRRAMAKAPDDRYRTAAELIDQLIELPTETRAPSSKPTGPDASGTPPSGQSAVALLRSLGMVERQGQDSSILNAFHATVVRACREVVGDRWPDVLTAAGLQQYLREDPADDAGRTASVDSLCQLGAGVEAVHGMTAAMILRHWGRATLDDWLRTTQRKPFRMRGRPDQRLRDTLYVLTRTLDRVRGAELHSWREFDHRHFWVAYQDNLLVEGRRASGRACHFAIGGLESALRWGGLDKEWAVQEVECGRVTGSGTCVFAIDYEADRGKRQ